MRQDFDFDKHFQRMKIAAWIYGGFAVAVLGLLAYVAVHFLNKYW